MVREQPQQLLCVIPFGSVHSRVVEHETRRAGSSHTRGQTLPKLGSTEPRWTAPRGAAVRVLTQPPSCAPCYRTTCAIPERYRCLRAVTADDAVRGLAAAMAAGLGDGAAHAGHGAR